MVVVDASARIAPISADQLGTNLGVWYNVTTPSLPRELGRVGAHLLRWPGGSAADNYHWRHHTACNGRTPQPAFSPDSTFANFMNDVAIPGGYDVAITVAYGTNAACNGGGSPEEAAAWVAYAKAHGYDSRIKFWTVGNESFGNWETDLHARAHDPRTYASAMSGPKGYYALMKAADPAARVGVVVTGNGLSDPWDSYVLSHAPYDFVELHWYAQQPHKESDSYLLNEAPEDFGKVIRRVRRELAAAGKPGTPIMVGELNSVGYDPGKQTVSIVNSLFAGQSLLVGIDDGLAADAWWFGDGGQQNCGNNNSPALYGFQNWGSYDLVFGSTTFAYNNCTSNTGGPIVPEGALSPSGQAFRLVSEFARPGQHLLSAASGSPDVRAYAATEGNGYSLLLFNLSESATKSMRIRIDHAAPPGDHYHAVDLVYGKAQYDATRNNVWRGPASVKLGAVSDTFSVTLPPWSISLVRLTRATEQAGRAGAPGH